MFKKKINTIIIIILCILDVFPKRLSNKNKKIIYLSFSVTNKYINLLFTSLFSLLENSDKNTIYIIYLQIGEDFLENNLNLISNLEKIYFNCFIIKINMGDKFSDAITGLLDESVYYRLELPKICNNINRILYIDCDTIILKDLMELYSLNFNGKYILGRLDLLVSELDSLGIYIKNYINSGILLMDLYNLRKYKYVNKFLDYLNKHNNLQFLYHHDQTLINYVCHDKIGILRPKYHMWPFENILEIIDLNKKFRIPYNETEFIQDYYNPFIIHFPGTYKLRKGNKNNTYYDKIDKYRELSKLVKNKF